MRRSVRVATAVAIARSLDDAALKTTGAAAATVKLPSASARHKSVKREASSAISERLPKAHVTTKCDLSVHTSVHSAHGTAAIKHEQSCSGSVKIDGTSALIPPSSNSNDNTQDEHWHRLCSTLELSCKLTLASGQTFAWRFDPLVCEWSGVIGDCVFALRERVEHVEFQCRHPLALPIAQARASLTHYFRLETDAAPLYAAWTLRNDAMAHVMNNLRGHRLVRQDPVECLFAFICSSNNNIQRIQQLVDKLRRTYGTLLLAGCADADVVETLANNSASRQASYYAFPSPETLASKCEEATLRTLGFGYRAAFIAKASQQLVARGGAAYLNGIRDASPSVGCVADTLDKKGAATVVDSDRYQDELMVFTGVGRKVADCVALFSLERLDAIPVDTHVWQIACREFDPSLGAIKSITPRVYKIVGDHFRTRFPRHAGWAHSVLFTGDLAAFQSHHLPAGMQQQPPKRRANTTAHPKTKQAKVVVPAAATVVELPTPSIDVGADSKKRKRSSKDAQVERE